MLNMIYTLTRIDYEETELRLATDSITKISKKFNDDIKNIDPDNFCDYYIDFWDEDGNNLTFIYDKNENKWSNGISRDILNDEHKAIYDHFETIKAQL